MSNLFFLSLKPFITCLSCDQEQGWTWHLLERVDTQTDCRCVTPVQSLLLDGVTFRIWESSVTSRRRNMKASLEVLTVWYYVEVFWNLSLPICSCHVIHLCTFHPNTDIVHIRITHTHLFVIAVGLCFLASTFLWKVMPYVAEKSWSLGWLEPRIARLYPVQWMRVPVYMASIL